MNLTRLRNEFASALDGCECDKKEILAVFDACVELEKKHEYDSKCFFYTVTDPDKPGSIVVRALEPPAGERDYINKLFRLCWDHRNDPKFGFVPLLEHQIYRAFTREAAPLSVWMTAAVKFGESGGFENNRSSAMVVERLRNPNFNAEEAWKRLEAFVNLPPEAFGIEPGSAEDV